MIYTSNIPEGLIPDNEKDRLQHLYRYKVLDTLPEDAFDNITKEVLRVFSSGKAFINFVDRDRTFFKSIAFKDAVDNDDNCDLMPRYTSFCAIAIQNKPITVFGDTHNLPQLMANPYVNGSIGNHNIRFYAAAPLCTPEGSQIGTLGTIDNIPHEVTHEQLLRLTQLAKKVMDELTMRLQLQQYVKGQLPN